MILLTVILSGILVSVLAQYPEELAPDAPPPPRREAPAFQPPPARRSPVFNPAAVHYVNIGHELQGDYKFGYDTGKGNDGQSFREETRLPDGTVKGAYGYVDASGRQRIVKYTAGKDGYKVEPESGSRDSAPAKYPAEVPQQREPAQQRSPPQPVYRAPEPAYNPPPQRAYSPPAQPAYRPAPPPQPAYRPPPQQTYSPPPRQAYTPPQETYNPPPRSSQPARPPVYSSPPEYADRPVRRRQQPQTYDYEEYDSPSNELNEPKIRVPIDTSLFNYNIGISDNKS